MFNLVITLLRSTEANPAASKTLPTLPTRIAHFAANRGKFSTVKRNMIGNIEQKEMETVLLWDVTLCGLVDVH
jgi:hypothetical protein